jgi:flagellar M-ring protein FliF
VNREENPTMNSFEKLKQSLMRLGGVARILVSLIVAAALAAVLLLGWKLLAPDYGVLFADLDPQDASAIVSELERMKVGHRLQDEGRTILVDRADVYRTRLKLMSKGVNLRGTVGFELFNESDFGMTEFAQKINYQRAMQGELARTIMGLEEVQSARVHLALPESGLLRRGDGSGKASVTIATRPGKRLQGPQVLGIQRLVAAAVPQIDPTAVTIIDSRGMTLSAASDAGTGETGGSGEAALEMKRQTEAYFVSKAAAVLDRAVGPGRAMVMVDAILNPDLLKITEEKVLVAPGGSGDGAVVRSKQTTLADTRPRGQTVQSAESASGGSHDTTISEVEFQHGKRIEQLVSAPGAIRRLSVGLVLPASLSEAQVRRLTEVVSMAVGLNTTRGDAISAYSLESVAAGRTEDDAAASPPVAKPVAASVRSGDVPAAKPAANAPSAGFDQTSLMIAAAAAVLLMALLAIALRRPGSASTPARLSEQERSRMLRDIHAWLGPRPPGGAR